MQDQRNIILAIVLSMAVMFGWQYFVIAPKTEQAAQVAQQEGATAAPQQQADDTSLPTPQSTAQAAGGVDVGTTLNSLTFQDRESAIAAQPRVTFDTPALSGSINLVGARLDDLRMKNYKETVDDDSPIITLLSPSNAPNGYFSEQGWVNAGGETILPDGKTEWQVKGVMRWQIFSVPGPVTF